MQYTFKSIIESLSTNWPTCDKRATVHEVILNCGKWFQSEIAVKMETKIEKLK